MPIGRSLIVLAGARCDGGGDWLDGQRQSGGWGPAWPLSGVEIEVIDVRSIQPLDTSPVVESVRRTGRLVTVHEAWVSGGLGAEIVARVASSCAARVARAS